MRVDDMTDAGLIRHGLTEALVARFGDKEFVVYRPLSSGRRDWVASIDTHDGGTEYTADPSHARIFRGAEWVRVWARPDYCMIAPDGRPLPQTAG